MPPRRTRTAADGQPAQSELPVASWRQSQRLEPGPTKRHTPIKRRLDVLPADEQPTDGVVQQLPTWMQHKRSLPPPAASEEEPLAAALLHAHDHSGAAPPHGAVAGRAGQMVAMARRTRPPLAGAAPRAGAGATVFTTAGGASATAMEEAQTFLEQERLRGFPETPPDSEDTDGRDANSSAVGAALAFLDESDKFRQSERRQKAAQVAKAKARTKALMAQRKPPRVATPHIGTSRAHLPPGMRRVRQSDTRYAFEKEAVNSPISAPVSPAGNAGAKERNAADLGVLSPELTPGRIQLPMRYIRLCQQFEFLDTALAFAKTRRQTEIVTYEVLRESVQGMSKRKFEVRQLLQIVAVAPGLFRLGWLQRGDRYLLTIDFDLRAAPTGLSCPAPGSACLQNTAVSPPGLAEERSGPLTTSEEEERRHGAASCEAARHGAGTPKKAAAKITPTILSERKDYFRQQLKHLVEKQQADVASHQGPGAVSGESVGGETITIADIEPAALPPRPDQMAAGDAEAEMDAAAIAEGSGSGPLGSASAVSRTLKLGGQGEGCVAEVGGDKVGEANREAKPVSLLERIRAKERAKQAREAESEAAAVKKRAVASQVLANLAGVGGASVHETLQAQEQPGTGPPASIASIRKAAVLFEMIRDIFRSRGPARRAMSWQELEKALLNQHSDRTATSREVNEQLNLLLQYAPDWCSQTQDPLTKTPIFCVNPNTPTAPIRQRLRELAA